MRGVSSAPRTDLSSGRATAAAVRRVWRREAIVNVTCPELPVSRSRGTTHGSSLDRLRLEIDEVDDRIVALLDARARLALGVARLKQQEKLAIHDPDRERRVLDRLAL